MKAISKTILDAANAGGFKWCILRKEDEILEGVENDIDLFVTRCDYPELLALLGRTFEEANVLVLRERRMPCGTSYLLYGPGNVGEFQKLDIVYDNTLAFVSLIPSDRIAAGIVSGIAYPVLVPGIAAELSRAKELARSDFWAFLRHRLADRSQPIRLPRLSIGGYLSAFLANARNRTGAFVVLVGPDGSGKTTVGEQLARSAKRHFFSVSLQHFSIPTFPRLATLLGRRRHEPDYTQPNSGTDAPIQSRKRASIYLSYYGLELMVYAHLRLRRRLRLGQLVIFDRYFHDWLFQRSYRNASRPMIRRLIRWAIDPTLVVYLRGNAAVINARKPELSAEEIALQQSLIETELIPFWLARGVPTLEVDTTRDTVDGIVAQIESMLTKV